MEGPCLASVSPSSGTIPTVSNDIIVVNEDESYMISASGDRGFGQASSTGLVLGHELTQV